VRKSRVLLSIFRTIVFIIIIFWFLVKLLVFFEKEAGSSSIHNTWEGLWYSLITITSVGYGDFVPSTLYGKLIGLVFALGSIVISTLVFSTVTTYRVRYIEEKKMGYKGCNFIGHTVILGWDTFARSVADQLVSVGNEVAIILDDKDEIDLILEHFSSKSKLVYTLYSEFDNFDLIKKSNIQNARMVFVNGATDTDKLVHVLTLKGTYPDLNYIVTLDNSNLKETFHSAGVTYPISKLEISSKLLASYIFEPDVAAFGEELMSYAATDEDFDIKQFYIKELHEYNTMSYDAIFFDLKKRFNTILIGISRTLEDGTKILIKNPEEEVIVQNSDYLIIISKGKYEEKLEEYFDVSEGTIN